MNTMTPYRMTRTEEILATGIDMAAVKRSGMETIEYLASEEEYGPHSVDEVTLEGYWSAGQEWMYQMREMLTAAVAAVSGPHDEDLVRLACSAWFEPMGAQEWELLATRHDWSWYLTEVEVGLRARARAGYGR